MTTRISTVTPYHSGSSSASPREKPTKVKVKANTSSSYNSDTQGELHAALSHRGPPLLPSDNHIWTHTTRVEPVGAHYSPDGEFGHRTRTGAGKGVYSYGGAPNTKGENANGSSPSNKSGSNALGRAMNKVGSNVLGKPSNRRGSNANGSRASNKTGEKSGYPKFTPKGGGRKL
jgi:hypothetical protein